jgi:hypothetical protein
MSRISTDRYEIRQILTAGRKNRYIRKAQEELGVKRSTIKYYVSGAKSLPKDVVRKMLDAQPTKRIEAAHEYVKDKIATRLAHKASRVAGIEHKLARALAASQITQD